MSRSPAPRFTELLDFAHELADASGRAILPHFRKQIRIDNKAGDGGFDPVTAADRAAERVISRLVGQRWPDHGIVGEEYGNRLASARFRWIIDPIDGTRSFMTGSPMWGTLIGLMDGERATLGLVDQPYTRERFWSGQKTSHMRDASGRVRRIKTRPSPDIGGAVMMTTHPDLFAKGHEEDAFHRVKRKARMTRYGGDCYSYCLLAAGFVDLVVETDLKPFDIVAHIPLIERAGGVITAWDGGTAADGGRIVAAGDPRLHETVLKMLQR